MNTLKILFGFVFLMIAFNMQTAHAQTVFMNRTAFDSAFPSANVENWDEYHNGKIINNGSTLHGITYQTNGLPFVVTSILPTVAPSKSIVSLFGDQVTFTFSQPLTAFSIDIDTLARQNGDFTATLSNGEVVDSYFDAFPGEGTGQFIGVSDSTSFDSVTIDDPDHFLFSLNTLQYVDAPSSVVPEPSTIALMLFGLAGIGGFALLRRFAVA